MICVMLLPTVAVSCSNEEPASITLLIAIVPEVVTVRTRVHRARRRAADIVQDQPAVASDTAPRLVTA